MNLLTKLKSIAAHIGNTPTRTFHLHGVECIAKLEYSNFSGSIKDRAVYNILSQGIHRGDITGSTRLIESSSGNFAISIASMCNILGLKFTGVIDPNITAAYEQLLAHLAYSVIKVTERDETGGFLLNRIREVKRNCDNDSRFFWTDQYENPDNYLAYYYGLGSEITESHPDIDYAFIAVSSCGTITGLSRKLKETMPSVKIVGVDIEGSLIFGLPPKKRFISGLGSSLRPTTIDKAFIDRQVSLSHGEIIDGCWELLHEQSLFAGASTGAMYKAIKQCVASGEIAPESKVLFLCCDKGHPYLDTIYNTEWASKMKAATDLQAVLK